jgi:hypothetical protein
VCGDLTETQCDPGPLEANRFYYWQVIAKNDCGQVNGPIWSFDTGTPAVSYHLVITERDPASGVVQIDPAPQDPNDMQFPQGSLVTLTASPAEGKSFKWWKVYDPNHPGDANYVVMDFNNPTTILMDADRKVDVIFKCGSSAGLFLPMMLGVLGLLAAAKRKR